ncbi:MAG: N-formylglutamate amidohydrolase [Planctomycetaceae bacterium]|nr:N-formylglutamate amidohydrolase [Planctomycetaceae bacterium]
MRSHAVLITAEHGGHRIPPEYRRLFAGANDVLRSHRGWDPGSLRVARQLASRFKAPLVACEISRLLVEQNRSRHHPKLFSVYSQSLDPTEREVVLKNFWYPHRAEILHHIRQLLQSSRCVVHIGVHSFTPVLSGVSRRTDIGLLYDPRRDTERSLCDLWRHRLSRNLHPLVIHRNQPYRGISDGLTTWLRTQFDSRHYCGIELEINNRHLVNWNTRASRITDAIAASLATALSDCSRDCE